MVKRLVLLHDSRMEEVQPEVAEFKHLAPELEVKGVSCEILDTLAMPDKHWEAWRDKAWVVSSFKHQGDCG